MARNKLPKRLDRRDRTWRAARRHQRIWHALVRDSPNSPYHRSVLYYAKRSAYACDCRSKKHGQPKRPTGLCRHDPSWHRNAYYQRRAWRVARTRWWRDYC